MNENALEQTKGNERRSEFQRYGQSNGFLK